MRTRTVIFLCFLVVQIHKSVGGKDTLHVSVLLETTHYFLSKYFTFFSDILEHAFKEIENRRDILPEYSLELIPKDTQVIKVYFFIH